MKELINIEALTGRISKLVKNGNRIKKIVKAVSISWTVFSVLAAIWALIPKEEKITGVDTQALIDSLSENSADKSETDSTASDKESDMILTESVL